MNKNIIKGAISIKTIRNCNSSIKDKIEKNLEVIFK